MKLLIENGATVNAKDLNGDEPLQIAFEEGIKFRENFFQYCV